jgi:hypothetical protein
MILKKQRKRGKKGSNLKEELRTKKTKYTRKGEQATTWKEEKPRRQSESSCWRSFCMLWSLM